MKTVEEWSNAFDTFLADYIRINQFGLTSPLSFDEYEKSIWLTSAQEEIIKGLYNGTITGVSFEGTEEARRQLDTLVQQVVYTDKTPESIGIMDNYHHYFHQLPEDCWYIVYEQAVTTKSDTPCYNEKVLDVYPVAHDSYQRVIKNPFRGPNLRRVLRLDFGKLQVEIVSAAELSKYLVRYLAKPSPIVLCDLTDSELSIEGVSVPTTCNLSEGIHQLILSRAVQLALASRNVPNNTNK